jgi:hypothetical protein
MKSCVMPYLSALSATVLGMAIAEASPSAVFQQLKAQDQQLLDAIAPGDRSVWDKVLAPEAAYVDENGAILGRAEFLASLRPLPAGTSGHISIVDYKLQLDGDVALVIHRDDEREMYHGVALRATYLTTETWLRRNGGWSLTLVHTYVVAVDPPALALPKATLGEYVGRYRMNDLIYEVRLDGSRLVGGLAGSTQRPLLAEAPDVFFHAGQPRSRRIFQRNADHTIVSFVDRREGEDLVFVRLPN